MKLLLTLLACTILTGCQSYVEVVGSYYDRRDPCQNAINDPDWTMPRFCGKGTSRVITRRVGTNKYVSRIEP